MQVAAMGGRTVSVFFEDGGVWIDVGTRARSYDAKLDREAVRALVEELARLLDEAPWR